MKRNRPSVLFFDLGILVKSIASRNPAYLAQLDPAIDIATALNKLRDEGVRMGIIGDSAGKQTLEHVKSALEQTFIYLFLDVELIIYSSVVDRRKDSSEIFKIAVVRAGLSASPEDCLFVGESSTERAFALEAGMQALHPDSFWRDIVRLPADPIATWTAASDHCVRSDAS